MTGQLFAAEYVFPGHPDKLSDAIADALVQAAARLEERALVGVEVAVHRNRVFITGRIGCRDTSAIDVGDLVRDVYHTAGYGADWEPAPNNVDIELDLCLGPLEDGEAEFREVADDQSVCVGYAIDSSETNCLPLEHWLANRIGRKMQTLRTTFPDLQLGPDGKLLVVVREKADGFFLDQVSCSLQQRAGADDVALHRVVRVALEAEMAVLSADIPGLLAEVPASIHVNGAGAFDLGGPEGDNGLSGKKLVVDAYGPRVPIGGGALSGKDFFKADRAGAIHARRLAKAVVLTGLTEEATVRLAWYPGAVSAQVLSIESGEGRELSVGNWEDMFDLSLVAAGERWSNRTTLVDIARYGHFTDPELPWEKVGFQGSC